MPSTRRKLAAAGLIIVVLAGLAAATPQAHVSNAVLRGWGHVVDPDRDCEVALKDGALRIGIPGKPHDFAAEVPNFKSSRDPVSTDQAHDRRSGRTGGMAG